MKVMVNLTFGEQVKIVLSRKGMTIKELAEKIEEKTGKKMSRQNLTQRLGRDNFQEQDMRMIAEILGCSFQLSILASAEAAEKASVIEEELPTEKELNKLAAKKEMKQAKALEKTEEEKAARDITVGELVDFLEESEETSEEIVEDVQEAVEVAVDEMVVEEAVAEEAVADEAVAEEVVPEVVMPKEEEQPKKIVKTVNKPKFQNKMREFLPIKKRSDEEEDLENGDVNPYTGREYQTNSVRMHPKRIGYVQVYDRKEHKWTDMTEWAFLGVEERKKATMGKDYVPPIYLD